MKKYFKDIPVTIQDEIYNIYRSQFEKIIDDTQEEVYNRVKPLLPFELTESAIRKNMKARYDIEKRKLDEDNTIDVYREKLNYDIHKHRRDKLIFNKQRRDDFDKKLLEEKFIEQFTLEHSKWDVPTHKNLPKNKHTIYVSDTHIGKYDYNNHVKMFKKILTKTLENYPVGDEVEFVFAGDIVDGLLRLSQLQQIKANMTEQVVWACKILDLFINNFKQNYVVTKIVFIDEDNHGELRPLGSNRNDMPKENLSKIISYFLETFCKQHKIQYVSGDTIEHNGRMVCHGHQFKNAKAIRAIYNKSVIGHYHHYENIGNEHIILPALVYGDDYTKSLGISENAPAFMVETNNAWKLINI